MRAANFLDKEVIDILVTNSNPGVFGFINYMEKKAWISYSENVTEALSRNIKLVGEKQHRIKKIEGWDVCIFARTKNRQEAKNHFRVICQNYKDKGLDIINKEFKYRVWGSIEPHFKKEGEYLYYIWIGTKKAKLGVLAIFDKAVDGSACLEQFKAGRLKEFPGNSKALVASYKESLSDKAAYSKIFED